MDKLWEVVITLLAANSAQIVGLLIAVIGVVLGKLKWQDVALRTIGVVEDIALQKQKTGETLTGAQKKEIAQAIASKKVPSLIVSLIIRRIEKELAKNKVEVIKHNGG